MSNMVVNTNVLALNSHKSLKSVGTMQSKSSARLSSGLRINSAADDAAGLSISEKMRAQIRGLDQASTNAQDAISLIQTAEGGMAEIDNMLQRVRELTVQASTDTNEHNTVGTGDRQKIQDEIAQLVTEIDAMSERTEFNKKKVINGNYEDPNATFKTASANYDNAKAAKVASADALVAAQKAYDDALKATGSTDLKALEDSLKTAASNAKTALSNYNAVADAESNTTGSGYAVALSNATAAISATTAAASALTSSLGLADLGSTSALASALNMDSIINALKNVTTTSAMFSSANATDYATDLKAFNDAIAKLDSKQSLAVNKSIIDNITAGMTAAMVGGITSDLKDLATQADLNKKAEDAKTIGSLKDALDDATTYAEASAKKADETKSALAAATANQNYATGVLNGLAQNTDLLSITINATTSITAAGTTAFSAIFTNVSAMTTSADAKTKLDALLATFSAGATVSANSVENTAFLGAFDTASAADLSVARTDYLINYNGNDDTMKALKSLVLAVNDVATYNGAQVAAKSADDDAQNNLTLDLTAKANAQTDYNAQADAYYSSSAGTVVDANGNSQSFANKADFDQKYAAAQMAATDTAAALVAFDNGTTLADMQKNITTLQAAYDTANTAYEGTAEVLAEKARLRDTAAVAYTKAEINTSIGALTSNGVDGMQTTLDGTKASLNAFLAEFSTGANVSANTAEASAFLAGGTTTSERAALRTTYLNNYTGTDRTMLALKNLVKTTDAKIAADTAYDTAYNNNEAAITTRNEKVSALVKAQTDYDKAASDPLRIAADGAMATKVEAQKTLNTAQNALNTATKTDEKNATNMKFFSNQMASSQVKIDALNGKEAGLYFQVGSNANQGMELSIAAIKSDVLGIGDGNGNTDINVLNDSGRDITEILDTLDTAISYVTTERSRLGAAQNRLEYTINSLDTSSENLSAAESRIRDTDMAKEMMNLTKANVLQQAATSMLAQANQAPQNVLQLLG